MVRWKLEKKCAELAADGAVKLFWGDKLTSITMRPAPLPPISMSKKTFGFAIALVVKREIREISARIYEQTFSPLCPNKKDEHVPSDDV